MKASWPYLIKVVYAELLLAKEGFPIVFLIVLKYLVKDLNTSFTRGCELKRLSFISVLTLLFYFKYPKRARRRKIRLRLRIRL